jgi:hypothetical protein
MHVCICMYVCVPGMAMHVYVCMYMRMHIYIYIYVCVRPKHGYTEDLFQGLHQGNDTKDCNKCCARA